MAEVVGEDVLLSGMQVQLDISLNTYICRRISLYADYVDPSIRPCAYLGARKTGALSRTLG